MSGKSKRQEEAEGATSNEKGQESQNGREHSHLNKRKCSPTGPASMKGILPGNPGPAPINESQHSEGGVEDPTSGPNSTETTDPSTSLQFTFYWLNYQHSIASQDNFREILSQPHILRHLYAHLLAFMDIITV